ncbi:VCBS repeat-containing protein [uncultured Mucilaginibacter sp.]|uniref:VCBS repeat-containing protein n=1 Tax=uncultured Mucilaginibacter sp. TaxID=797541 RepID=UPI002620F79D|nr:VCBS repeat-containing protein [uncultured Mucilaginibacter sp.]
MLYNSFRHAKLLTILIAFACASCSKKDNSNTLFKLLPASETGVEFKNTITESDSLNILNHPYLYNGAGVGIGDFNHDGLPDVYFAGNQVSNKIYLNKGGLKFQDITDAAAVGGEGRWCTGVSVVDINADGWPDIYVCASFNKDPNQRRNLLYINQKLNKDGIPTFKESAHAYGIDDNGYSTQGIFFDYNHDGLLDLYVLTNVLDKGTPVAYRPKVADGSAVNNDRLYKNNGNGTFTNVTKEAGILMEGFGNSVSITDVNNDGWPDIYVGNDFISNDLLYINNKNGTFTNRAGEYFKHTGWSVMGSDMVDINNDGLPDLVSLEMLPEENLRKKTMLMGDNYITYIDNKKYNYEHQYIRNVLQLNQGKTPSGHTQFSEVAYLAGMYQTDWSWTPLVADFDNDGYRDMVITNGYPRDVTDLDHALYSNSQGRSPKENTSLASADSFPVVKTVSYAFKNAGGYTFKNQSANWGITKPAFSTGGVYADLDNDGDLDLVVNNIDEPAFIYENTLNNKKQVAKGHHYLSVGLTGNSKNTGGIGASIRIYYQGKQQFYDQQPCRGYLSTDDAKAHFGLGDATTVDSLRIRWPDGKTQLLTNIKTDQTINLAYKNSSGNLSPGISIKEAPLFQSVTKQAGINYKHEEKDAIDYNIQPTLPHKLSQYGPCIAVGDIDNNGYDDFYIGGSAGNKGTFFMQDKNGRFTADTKRFLHEDFKEEEDMGAILFDANNDGFLDMYVVSGSYEFPKGHSSAQDRLYINNGKGQFERNFAAVPIEYDNGSCVRAADFDKDGDLDLFVGGRSVSGAYPASPVSHLLRNEGGKFVDVTKKLCPELEHAGMITDALWSDFDNDGLVDLVVAGEWMPITFYRNNGRGFTKVNNSGVEQHVGWWNSLVAGDFNNDGKMDYVAGNLGQNSNYKATFAEPMTILAKDVDNNGSYDAMIFCYMKAEDGTQKPFPMHTRDDLISQVISTRKKFPTYKGFGRATMDDLWSKQDKENAVVLKATDMNTSFIENMGNGKFSISAMPIAAQMAPVYGMVARDIDQDGFLDLLMVGNDYGMEPFTGRHDAFMGLYLKGNGKGGFSSKPVTGSGFFVDGDAKGLAVVHRAKGNDLYIASQNQDSLKVFSSKVQEKTPAVWINLKPTDFYADLIYKNNRKKHVEFYYGSTYLSQSSRKMELDKDAEAIFITDYQGNKRKVK